MAHHVDGDEFCRGGTTPLSLLVYQLFDQINDFVLIIIRKILRNHFQILPVPLCMFHDRSSMTNYDELCAS